MTRTQQEEDTEEFHWAALMASAQSGSEPEYQQLLTELSAVISRYLRSRFGQHHFVEDCVQDTLIAVHEARHTWNPRRRFKPWLFAIVRHKAIDHLRRQQSHQKIIDREQLGNTLYSENTPETQYAQGQLISALSAPHREAITLTKIIGLSNAEAASQASISQSAMKVRVHRAIGRLKQLLEADQP